jgi:hypothetical protein
VLDVCAPVARAMVATCACGIQNGHDNTGWGNMPDRDKSKLERRVEALEHENNDFQERIVHLERLIEPWRHGGL